MAATSPDVSAPDRPAVSACSRSVRRRVTRLVTETVERDGALLEDRARDGKNRVEHGRRAIDEVHSAERPRPGPERKAIRRLLVGLERRRLNLS